MKSRTWWAGSVSAVMVLAVAISALAEPSKHVKYSGVINDFTPQNVSGPWEVHGHWSLTIKGDSGKADFSAALTMARSDAGVANSGDGDLNDPVQRNAHTHHITLLGGQVTAIPNGFRVTGPAIITANGKVPPPFGPTSALQIDVTGGNSVEFSNIAVTFELDAANHFGTAPLHGVVRSVRNLDKEDEAPR
jgi:hypothetical protein